MNLPTITSVGDVYILNWKDEKVAFKIDRLSEKSEGTTGEILISYQDKHLYHARVNLLSPHAKKIVANELARRINGLDWDIMVEQAFVKTLTEYRRGEPIIQIGNLPRRTTPRYRLKPLILEGQINAIYAHGGSGKTLLSDLIALCVQCGVKLLGLEPIKGNVLILDWETSEVSSDERIKAIKKGMDIRDEGIPYYRRCFHLLTHDIFEVQKEVLNRDIKLVIVDSAGMASMAMGSGSDYHIVAIEMLRALRSLNLTTLIIDHKPKEGNTMFGSVYKFNECRSAFEIKSIQEADSNVMDMAIFHTKFNDTPKCHPFGFHIEFEGNEDITEKITFTQKDVSSIAELADNIPATTRILSLLASGPQQAESIMEELNLSKTNTYVSIKRLRDKGLIIKLSDNSWGLSYKE